MNGHHSCKHLVRKTYSLEESSAMLLEMCESKCKGFGRSIRKQEILKDLEAYWIRVELSPRARRKVFEIISAHGIFVSLAC